MSTTSDTIASGASPEPRSLEEKEAQMLPLNPTVDALLTGK